MQHPSFTAAVLMQWTRLNDRWQSEKWEAVGVTGDEGAPPPPTLPGPVLLHQDHASARWLHPGYALTLYRDEAEGYYLNLSAPQPFVFVTWRLEDGMARPTSLTLSYNEAARMMDAGEQVDGVPMPEPWRASLAAFVALHYRPETKRNRARPPSFKGARRDEP
ncbi:MAG: hypothetical protein A2V78_02305 [Betaproteobacteria bacterium RBG_16_64_18]|nr:MAG: hypothetical protein A2V78_02305 [Betaproteobacteria bacterium RBG_16_64_18]OGA39589.1 MAG: hypothetical protein A3G26_05305 [Betaproteobacteria bacterium RIFCSPLOWO2_12_FULL_65_110]